MRRWEYTTLEYDDGGLLSRETDLETHLNDLGEEGWELTGTIVATETSGTQTTKLILKRPVE